jgi:hypothetical protein
MERGWAPVSHIALPTPVKATFGHSGESWSCCVLGEPLQLYTRSRIRATLSPRTSHCCVFCGTPESWSWRGSEVSVR